MQRSLLPASATGLCAAVVLFFALLHAAPEPAAPVPDEHAVVRGKLPGKLRAQDRTGLPGEAQRFYVAQRVPPGQSVIPFERYAAARRKMDALPRFSVPLGRMLAPGEAERAAKSGAQSDLLWMELGPGNVGGRTRALVVDPATPTTLYAAGVAGGVWKSTDGGASWNALDDFMASLAVTVLAMDPSDPQTLYAGTGEGFFNADAVRGDGLFVTTDGGATWTQLAATADNSDFYYVSDVVVSANDPQRLYAATRTGVWRSTDGGATWSNTLAPYGVNSRCLDLEIRTDVSPDNVVASCGTFGSAPGRVYGSPNGGDTWSQLIAEPDMGRTSLAIAPSNQNVMYALAASTAGGDYQDGLHKVFRSTDGGYTWSTRVANTDPNKLNTVLLSNPVYAFYSTCVGGNVDYWFNQGWYDNVIAVDPADPNVVWAGGIDLFRSDDGGANWDLASFWWTQKTNSRYAHADQHALVFHPDYDGTTNQQLFVGNDGGVFRTDNARAATVGGAPNLCNADNGAIAWTSLNNGYGVTQFYHGAVYPDGLTYLGGTQDNGTVQDVDDGNGDNWADLLGGDGGYVAVDPTNTSVLFAENTGLSIQKSTNGGASWTSATAGITDGGFQFIAPFTMNDGDPNNLWTGGSFLWRTVDQAATWQQASTAVPGGSVSAVAVAPTNADYVVAGTSAGYLLASQAATSADETTTWSTSRPTAGVVSSVAFDPTDETVVYATYSSFGVDHVWKSTDAGLTWTAVDARGTPDGLPDLPAHSVVVDPRDGDRLLVGTDLGLFVTDDGGATWAVENGGLANTVVEAVDAVEEEGSVTFYAFTHGRGAFRALSAALPVELTAVEAVADGGDVTVRWTTASERDAAGFEVQTRRPGAEADAADAWQALDFVAAAGPQTYTYVDAAPVPGRRAYRLKLVDRDGTFRYSDVVETSLEVPGGVHLSAAYPNPFNPQTQFTLTVTRAQQVRVEVFDALGRRVRTLHDGRIDGGEAQAFRFEAADLPSGLYVVRAVGETFRTSRTVTLVK